MLLRLISVFDSSSFLLVTYTKNLVNSDKDAMSLKHYF
ncbi:hypothetical protein A6A12_1440 [Vibrio anguillarum]|nr:hypothetical protein A6A12_1440 [Vibrio anguillarum]